ncbi:2-hydroxyacid dehydrogenase [Pseudoprimorskyibacter insulae]|uniref:2-ketogluconate reductase n=1 Tax=Pseudoprimorskyibacter insulae TaxID=1695997 RepID=A0A2R8APL5_9RHOB|nr:2-hydroxyacid dehydrogenase [Pseudoprimorskyibacter insulae]SPF78002.1 2-ketogluconate reductase [Pseudoprimorskyibacter insulae]
MTSPKVLAIGSYTPIDATALTEDLQAQILPNWDAVAALSTDDRANVVAVAYKGHHAFGGDRMDLFPNLKLIANFGVGYDAIDVSAATPRGIKVTNTPDVLNDDVADTAVALLLSQCRALRQGEELVRSGNWSKGDLPLNRKVSGGKVGILGLGRIGREIADRLAAFKMDIHYYARSEKDTPGWTFHADPVALAEAVDFLVVALVGGKETEKFVSRQVLEALGPRGVIVNISRGTTIDEEAMIQALQNGTLGGAGLDVFLNEPNIDPRFAALENVALQPHQGSGTVETRAAMGQLQRDNIANFLNGTALLTPVN